MSLAIAYAMKKKSKKCHGGEMAEGGDVDLDMVEESSKEAMSPIAKGMKKAFKSPGYAEGGPVKKEKASGYEHLDKHKAEMNGHPRKLKFGPSKDPMMTDHEGKPKKMAHGGEVDEMASGYQPMPHPCENCGHVSHSVENQGMGEEEDMIGRIMKKRKGYSEGGRVANDSDPIADSEPAEYDDLVKDDGLEFHETAENSGDEIGDEQEDEDRKDIVSRVMKSRKKKDKMPHPA